MTDILSNGALAESVVEVVTSGSPLVLTTTSPTVIRLTGVTAQTLVLPDATTLFVGMRFEFINRSSATATIQYDDLSTLTTLTADSSIELRIFSTATSNGVFDSSGTGGGGTAIGSPVTGATTGSVLFVGAGADLAQDNANFFWDDTNNKLVLATAGTSDGLGLIHSGTAGDGIDVSLTGVANGGAALRVSQAHTGGSGSGINVTTAAAPGVVVTSTTGVGVSIDTSGVGVNSSVTGANEAGLFRSTGDGRTFKASLNNAANSNAVGLFEVSHASSAAECLELFNFGLGQALVASVSNVASSATAVQIVNNGTGRGLSIAGTSTDDRLRLSGSTSGHLGITVPAVVTNYTITLPDAEGVSNTYLKHTGSGVYTWATVSGSGDVVGPASSTDEALVRFDGVTGKLLQDSVWTLSNTGVLSLSGSRYLHSSGAATNFFAGDSSGNLTVTSVNNTAVGNAAAQGLSTGAGGNTFLGSFAGTGSGISLADLSTGTNCTFIGYQAVPSSATLINATAVGANAIATLSQQFVLGDSAVVRYQLGADATVSQAAVARTFKPGDAFGTDQGASVFTVQTARSTGTGTNSGMRFQVSPAATVTSASLNGHVTVLTLTSGTTATSSIPRCSSRSPLCWQR